MELVSIAGTTTLQTRISAKPSILRRLHARAINPGQDRRNSGSTFNPRGPKTFKLRVPVYFKAGISRSRLLFFWRGDEQFQHVLEMPSVCPCAISWSCDRLGWRQALEDQAFAAMG